MVEPAKDGRGREPTPDPLAGRVTEIAAAMRSNRIIEVAREAVAAKARDPSICNLTIGDFDPESFRIPAELREGIVRALEEGHTNYPPPDGIPELKAAVAGFYRRELGLDVADEAVCICSGARPAIYATWRTFVRPGDRTVSFRPAWNVGYYAHMNQSDHRFVATRAEHDFFPTVEEVRRHLRGARLVVLNSPLNPTGTVVKREVLAGIAEALVEENLRRGWDPDGGGRGREPPCILLYDQVYWMLRGQWIEHFNPAVLVPECAPWVVHVDAISKCFAATGLRVGWAVVPPAVLAPFAALIGHMGAWAPRAEQVATARFLSSPELVRDTMVRMSEEVGARLVTLYEGIQSMRRRGLPVDAIPPQGAIHLSFRVDLIGRGFDTNEQIRRWLLREAGLAVVPFQAFDMPEESGWLRMSVGTVRLAELGPALERLEAALRRHLDGLGTGARSG